jgi:hypothetical protein
MSSQKTPPPPEEEKDPAWTFGREADYARSDASPIELGAALVVVAVWVGMTFWNAGVGYALRSLAFYLLPLLCIWKPDVLGGIGARIDPFTKIDAPTPARIVRVCGWLWLFFPVWVYAVAKLVMWSTR